MNCRLGRFASVLLVVGALPIALPADPAGIDACRSTDPSAVQSAWTPMEGTAPAEAAYMDSRNALKFRCNFGDTKIERNSRDSKVNLDLSTCHGIQFQMFCRDPRSFS